MISDYWIKQDNGSRLIYDEKKAQQRKDYYVGYDEGFEDGFWAGAHDQSHGDVTQEQLEEQKDRHHGFRNQK